MREALSALAGVLLHAASVAAAVGADGAGDWPCWRGPNRDGRPVITGIRTDWTTGLKKLWEVDGLCKGRNNAVWSAPVVRGDKLIVPGREGERDTVLCLNADTGSVIWKTRYAAPARKPVQYGNGARATPYIDGDHVYTFGCLGHVACWKLADGALVWRKHVDQLGGQRPEWGHASSPLVYQDKVIVQGGGKVLVIAFAKKTGGVAWTSMMGRAGYAAPILARVGGEPQLIVFAAAGLFGLSPDDGKKLWAYPHRTAYDMNCTTPVLVGGDKLLISSSTSRRRGGTTLVTLTANGVAKRWHSPVMGAGHNDPVVVDGHIYAYSGYSMNPQELQCLELATGKLRWRTAVAGGPGNVLYVDGHLLCLGNRGRLTLVKPSGRGFHKVAQFQAIRGRPVWTVPVIARGKVYVRFTAKLICYQLKSAVEK